MGIINADELRKSYKLSLLKKIKAGDLHDDDLFQISSIRTNPKYFDTNAIDLDEFTKYIALKIGEHTGVEVTPYHDSGDKIATITVNNVPVDIYASDIDTIAELTDVELTDLADGDILKYDSAAGKWKNAGDNDHELPVVTSADEGKVLTVDATGQWDASNAINERIAYLEQNAEMIPDDVYGVEVDYDNSIFTRLGGAVGKSAGSDFDSLTPWARRRCNVTDDGTVLAYYGETGYTETGALTEEIVKDGTAYPIGTSVQVMVEQQPFYYKVVPMKLTKNTDSNVGYHGNKIRYFISAAPREGFTLHPAFYGDAIKNLYIGAYEATYYDSALDKIYDDDSDTSTATNTGDLLCSIGNGQKPISGLHKVLDKAHLETVASNRGTGWHLETIQVNMANILLMLVEYASLNSQAVIGNGVIDISDSSAYNCASLTGSTESLGNASGAAASTVNRKGESSTTETVNGKVSVSYRGVENIWGNIWKHINGINIHGNGAQAGGQIFVNPTLAGFSEQTTASPYVAVAVTLPKADGYIKYFGFDSSYPWLLFPSKTGSGADSAKPIGDYCYKTENLNGYRIARSGGFWAHGSRAGASYWGGTDGAGFRSRAVGGRLMYKG